MSKWIFLNTDFVEEDRAKLHVRDLATLRGYGVFDFFKVIDATPVFLNDHLDRFYYSAGRLRLVVPYSKAELQDLIYQLIRKNEIQNCGIRITLTGGYSEDGYLPAVPNLFITTHTLPDQFKEHYDTGIPLTIWEHQRQLPDVKSIDYLMAIWLQPVLLQKEAFDVLYHSRGWITECPRSNFFIITKDDILVTPMDGILKGITRKQILKIADSILPIEERPVSLEELKHAKEAFITSTSKVILPVSRIDNLFQNNGQTPFTDMLLEAFLQYRAKDISSAANKGNR